MNPTVRRHPFAATLAAFALLATAALPAEAGGRHGGRGHGHGHVHSHHRHPGVFWGGLALGIGAAAVWHHHQQAHAAAWGPAPVYVAPPPVAYTYVEPAPVLPRAPEPVIYPRMGQSPAQTEADRQDCNRWATTHPGAMADAGVFHRATIACMEGRGYTVR